ncbi:MAG: hypothetical protein WC450_01160 [Candidatus Omnitrophota bacterium]|jgi:hypothetical protein
MGTNKDFSLGSMKMYMDFLYIGAFLFVIGFMGQLDGSRGFSILVVLGSLGLLAAAICLAVRLHRLWAFVIDASLASGLKPSIASPGIAVGRLFIPVYQFYWIFVCLRGLSKDLSALAAQSGLSVRVSTVLGTAVSLGCLLGCIPFLNFFFAPVTTLILWPIFLDKISSFARNLKIYGETGKNLFIAGDMARKKMILARNYGDLFPEARTSYPLMGNIIVLVLIGVGCYVLSAELLRIWGRQVSFFMPGLLAGMIVYAGQRLKSPLLSIGTWVILSSAAGVNVSLMLSSYYGDGWILRGGFITGIFLYGLFFIGLLSLTIRLWGVRWWGIFLVYVSSFFLFSFIGEFIYGAKIYTAGIGRIYAFLDFVALTTALDIVFYLNTRMKIEEKLLRDGNN